MPIYEFRCESCQEVFEHLAMSSGDNIELKCPHCGGQELSRVMSACASVVDNDPSGSKGAGVRVENRTCQGSGSCSSIVLPGHGD